MYLVSAGEQEELKEEQESTPCHSQTKHEDQTLLDDTLPTLSPPSA